MNNVSNLLFDKEICFPLYVCSKGIISKYKPFLEELDLTYTQYIAMNVLWEKQKMTVNELGKYLYLDSGTLTPLLKKLEAKYNIVEMTPIDMFPNTHHVEAVVLMTKA